MEAPISINCNDSNHVKLITSSDTNATSVYLMGLSENIAKVLPYLSRTIQLSLVGQLDEAVLRALVDLINQGTLRSLSFFGRSGPLLSSGIADTNLETLCIADYQVEESEFMLSLKTLVLKNHRINKVILQHIPSLRAIPLSQELTELLESRKSQI